MTKSQQKFEEWVKNTYRDPCLKKMAFNRYVVQKIQNLWEDWQLVNNHCPEPDSRESK